jgi:hypothetical protein
MQTLGWTTPKLRSPDAADRWTWLLLTADTQLRLARDLTTDLRLPMANRGMRAPHKVASLSDPLTTR